MPKPITPINSVLLCLDRVMNDEIITNGGLKLYLDPSWHPEWSASVTGVVFGIPINSPKNIKLSDEVAFSYTVVADRSCTKPDYFQPIIHPSPIHERYINGKGETLTVCAFSGNISKIYSGAYVSRRNELIDGIQGTESEVQRWKSQFNFSSNGNMKFNNLFNFNGKDYWRADIEDVFAKRVKGEIVAIGDRIIMLPVEEDVKTKIELYQGKPMPYRDVRIRYMDRGKIVSGGEELGFKKGDVVSFDERYLEKYSFWNKNYFLIKSHRVNGIWT